MTTNNTTLIAYSQEIAPMIRAVAYQKELLKDFKDTDAKAVALAEAIKEAQQALKDYLDENDESKAIITSIKELETDLKEAIKGAAKGTDYKPAELKGYSIARSKDDGVVKVVDKGELFSELNGMLQ